MPPTWDQHLLTGLKELAESAFPKRCKNCGREYRSSAEYLERTLPISSQRSGLKEGMDDDGQVVVELFRNCECGSTLMDFFSDRRDMTETGVKRRERFSELLVYLQRGGLETSLARSELLKVLRGEKSDVLSVFHPSET